jgi:eukaryotic-like serine/threonine-protein kinase
MAGTPAEGSDAARERAAALIGRTLSERYRIVSLVAMGGMGAIYRAEHLLMRKHVAVKVLHPEVEGFPELVARFEREAVAGAHIEHPNVATASDFGKFDGGSAFLVLGFIEGITLRELIDRGPVPPRRAAWIIRQAAAGLAAVHQKGVVHRDIKPKNIMIVEDSAGGEDVVKVIDFGLAKVPVEELSAIAQDADNPRRSLTQAGVVLGTLGYLAPEAALGTRSILAPADLYALGVVFYEMLCGKPPFEGTDAARVFLQHRTSPVPALRERNPDADVPPELEAIVRRMLEKDPDARYPSATALVSALDEALGIPAAPTSERGGSSSSAIAMPRRPRRAIWIAGAAALAIGAIAMRGTTKRTPVASEAPPASSASAPVPVEPPPKPPPRAPDALERLRTAADGEAAAALTVLVDVADAEPRAFADRAVQTEAAGIVEAAASKGLSADLAFDRLSGVLGSDGLDVLYDLTARERAASAASKARAILAKPDVLARATPAMRIAYDLRRAPCPQRPNLFKRAAKEGDDRALEVLRSMQAPACTKKDACCFEKNHQLELTIADIQARLRH